jgi:hypothetical protein
MVKELPNGSNGSFYETDSFLACIWFLLSGILIQQKNTNVVSVGYFYLMGLLI